MYATVIISRSKTRIEQPRPRPQLNCELLSLGLSINNCELLGLSISNCVPPLKYK